MGPKSYTFRAMPRPVCPLCGAKVPPFAGPERPRCAQCGASLWLVSAGSEPAMAVLDCPSCGAAIDVPEGSLVAVCSYCGGRHLMTGQGLVLRWRVPAAVDAAKARAQAAEKLGAAPAGEPSLVYAPYWRLRGLVYTCEAGFERNEESSEPTREAVPPAPTLGSVFVSVVRFEKPEAVEFKTLSLAGSGEEVRKLEAVSIDRSVLAAPFRGPAGLGSRFLFAARRPYDPKRMAGAEILPAEVPREEALKGLSLSAASGLRDLSLEREMEVGSLVASSLSLVWYPYWVFVEGGRRLVVDGTGAGVVDDGPAEGGARTASGPEGDGSAPGLVPSRCPRCAADLALEPFQAVYFCAACQSACRVEGRDLVRVPVLIVKGEGPVHVPLWRLRVAIETPAGVVKDQAALRRFVPGTSYVHASQDPALPAYIYLPGWGNRLAPRLSQLALRCTREQPALEFSQDRFQSVVRALFGPKEAEALASIAFLGVVYLRPDLMRMMSAARLRVEAADLLLLPGRMDPFEWVDGRTGTAVPRGELREPRPQG